MTMLLALDTSTPTGSVAVGEAGRPRVEVAVGVRARQAESLLPSIDFALRSLGLAPGDLGGVVVAAGPGSFTGVRIAAATAKGFVRALGIPLYAYSSLLSLAAALGSGERPVWALFDARRGEVYAACYRFPGLSRVERLREPAAVPLETVLAEGVLAAGEASAPLFVGEGALRHRERIEAEGGVVAPPFLSLPRAGALLWLAAIEPAAGRVEEAAAWEPSYLRGSGAVRGVRG